MKSWLAAVACVAVAACSLEAGAAPPAAPGGGGAPENVRLLDVPYVPQSGALCGGAALAMVLRYWGESAVLAEDFAPLVEPGSAGIRTDALVESARLRGWTALAVTGDPSVIRSQLAAGRPVIALLDRAGSGHYVVLVAWANGGVIVHDPAVGPYRVSHEREFLDHWAGSGRWALLVLPQRPVTGSPAAMASSPDSSADSMGEGCDAIVDAGIFQARRGDPDGAELRFLAARALCPESAAPLRELAGLRFRLDDWAGAARLAERALALEPADSLTWRLLAGSLYLGGDTEGALAAWNRLAEPRADVTRVDGLVRTRFRAVADQLDLQPRRLITPGAFLRARRRLAELPSQSESRLSLTPLPRGEARVNAALLERPLLFDGPWDAGGAAARSFIEREVSLDLSSPSGNGELWSAEYRWWAERPRLSLELAVPAAGGRPGVWRVNGLWERQTYAGRESSGAADSTAPGLIRERRRRTSLSWSDWVGPNLRLETRAALDKWVGRGAFASIEAALEARSAGDRLGLTAEIANWAGSGSRAPFRAGRLLLRWGSSAAKRGGWQARIGMESVSAGAPLALWPGAGTGHARATLLRAHPLLDGGVLDGPVFGRTLLHAGLERRGRPWTIGPLRLGWAAFVDGARPRDTLGSDPVPWLVDGGVGLRLGGMGRRGQLRLDVARSFSDGESAVSVGWGTP